jgi:hypothetical protein
MKNQKGVASIIPVIIIVVLLAVTGFFAYKYYFVSKPSVQPQVQGQQQNQNQQQQTVNQQISQTAGWKTYTDSRLNISFQYPGDWSLVSTIEDDTNYNGAVLTPPNMPSNYNIIYISQVGCQSIIQQRPGKIATCKQIGNSSMAVYDSMNTDDNNSRTDTIIDKIISTFKFTK